MDDLEHRGLIAQATDIVAIRTLLTTSQTVYCGFDPTAGSLHIGHLVPLLLLKRFKDAGHQAIALLGGATGMIGDPSFKAAERSLNSTTTVDGWVQDLSAQIQRLMQAKLKTPMLLINNADWLQQVSVINFFRDVGKHFSVNSLLNRESVKQRLKRPEQGISFTEFSYSLLQAYDFSELNQRFACRLQIGGNDQWGNIVSGIDFTRRISGNEVFGLTLPLITKADGTKFGKTESGTVWLDATKTSPYAFYQFWLNTADADVYRFLRYYTFLSCEDIARIEDEDKARKSKPQAQHVLAEELTHFVHGETGLASARRISEALFSGEVKQLQLSELQQLELDGLPTQEICSQDLLEALIKAGLASSKRAAREFLASDAIRVNGDKVAADQNNLGFALFDQYWLLQRGKKHFVLLKRAQP
ncbi:tyrosyl-tRNA synthetase [Rheinheimera pacifica]|uniref:Tyrosine--tRNA ligase n=2 Tax=Rheinheimera pacifica TaxID=173990 RepID=A0A1H6KPI4_9GAMM|nr:tyrosyl-tRNA synthetase [Rheinheimera pacifica]